MSKVHINTPEYTIILEAQSGDGRESVFEALKERFRTSQAELIDLTADMDDPETEHDDMQRRREMFSRAITGDPEYRDLLTDKELARMRTLQDVMVTQHAIFNFNDTYSAIVN